MTQGCDCPHQADRHFPNGKCAVMNCRCVRQPLEETMTLSDVIDGPKDEGKRSAFHLPPFDPDAAWQRTLGKMILDVNGLEVDVDRLKAAAQLGGEHRVKTDETLLGIKTELSAIDERIIATAEATHIRIDNIRDAVVNRQNAHSGRLDAIERRLGDFKLTRQGKKRNKK